MKAEMVAIKAEDGVLLHGAYYEGREDNPAVVLLPGAAMNFYTGVGAFLPAALAENGFACLNINHRGHDVGTAPDPVNPRVIGAIFDCFEDCVLDIRAMVDFLEKRGANKIVLAGHSQGALKILYALREEKMESVAGVIIMSAPTSASDIMRFLLRSHLYEDGLQQAQELAEKGEHDHILVFRGRGNLPYPFSVRTFLNIYAPDSPTDTVLLAEGFSYPMLAIRGQYDLPPVPWQLLETVKSKCNDPDLCHIVELEGANHFYVGHEKPLGDTIVKWLNDLMR
ncbi:MAG: alpha/beta hydrolase [Syntrophomonadales bacterium]|jgi:pimeloyl-ACP methyl ester carboxylesterase